MNIFTASNGITVYAREGGTVQFQHATRAESCGILQVFPHSEWWDALREFFRAEEDERLGRWRTPDHPGYIVHVHDGGRYVWVSKEVGGASSGAFYRGAHDTMRRGSAYAAAARAYFDAHPEPKPWDTAKTGSVWEFTYEVPGRVDLGYPPIQTVTRLYTRTDAGWRSMGRKNAFLSIARVTSGRHVWGPVEP